MRRSLERIYRNHRQGMYSLALSITRRPQAAEDAVQEAFVKLWRLGRAPQGDPVAYTYAAVRNAAIDQAGYGNGATLDAASLFNGRLRDPATDAAEHEVHGLISQAVDDLPDDQRQVVVLKVYGGLTFEQIARVCGEPISTVASRYRRVLQKLKEQLEQRL